MKIKDLIKELEKLDGEKTICMYELDFDGEWEENEDIFIQKSEEVNKIKSDYYM